MPVNEPQFELRDLSSLKAWKNNPRRASKQDIKRLASQIKKLGQYKPLIVVDGVSFVPDGTIVGGNMRQEAFKLLKIKKVWVSVIKPQDESEMYEYAFSDNDRAGYYDTDMLANLDLPHFNLGDFNVDISPGLNLDKIYNRDDVNPNEEWAGMPEFNQENKKAFKQLLVNFESEKDYNDFCKAIQQTLTPKTKSIWYPAHVKGALTKGRTYVHES